VLILFIRPPPCPNRGLVEIPNLSQAVQRKIQGTPLASRLFGAAEMSEAEMRRRRMAVLKADMLGPGCSLDVNMVQLRESWLENSMD